MNMFAKLGPFSLKQNQSKSGPWVILDRGGNPVIEIYPSEEAALHLMTALNATVATSPEVPLEERVKVMTGHQLMDMAVRLGMDRGVVGGRPDHILIAFILGERNPRFREEKDGWI